MVRAFELWNVDHVIALKFPAYLIRHPKKTLWLVHQYRQAYDLYDAGQTNLPPGEAGLELQTMIRQADQEAFAECRKIFSISEVTRRRLLKYNRFDSEVLVTPPNDPELFPGGELGDYIFAGGRVNGMKRQHLLLEAMAQADKRVKLLIAGPPDSPDDAACLRAAVERFGLADRVRLDLRFLPRQVYAGYVNRAAAVAYLPYDEESLGYVAMEGATAAKALITTADSGGILGLVKHEDTGWVAHPSADDLARVMEAVFENAARTKMYGQSARALLESMKINWPDIVEALLR